MKVLVIGGAGYIGSHVVKELMAQGHKVTVFDNLSSGLKQNLFKENDFIEGDILNKEQLDAAFAKGFDAYIHLAAFKAAGESMIKPEKYSVNNITGTLNILNSAVEHDCKLMVFSSSAAVFGEPQYLPIDENHPKNPENYYGYTKLSIEQFMKWYDQLKGLKFAALRYFNAAGYDPEGVLYGLEQNPANLLPIIMEVACGMREKMKIFGNDYDTRDGTCIRDYVHVTDFFCHLDTGQHARIFDDELLATQLCRRNTTERSMISIADIFFKPDSNKLTKFLFFHIITNYGAKVQQKMHIRKFLMFFLRISKKSSTFAA